MKTLMIELTEDEYNSLTALKGKLNLTWKGMLMVKKDDMGIYITRKEALNMIEEIVSSRIQELIKQVRGY